MKTTEEILKELNIDLYTYIRIVDETVITKYREAMYADEPLPSNISYREISSVKAKTQYKYRGMDKLPPYIKAIPKTVTNISDIESFRIYAKKNGRLPKGITYKTTKDEYGISRKIYLDYNDAEYYELEFAYYEKHEKDQNEILFSVIATQTNETKALNTTVKDFKNLLITIAVLLGFAVFILLIK